jgi:hypothetical protein
MSAGSSRPVSDDKVKSELNRALENGEGYGEM